MTRALALASLVVAGCLDVPPAPHGQCNQSDDCASGEVCEENVCWGNPPLGAFAATLAPPSDRTDLVLTEIPSLDLPLDGWLGDLVMPAPATLSGRVETYCAATTCDTTASLGATITITRRSLFPGGAGFRGVFAAKDGLARGTDSFTATIPRSQPGDPDFVITVLPDGRDKMPPSGGAISPAMLAPPHRVTMAVAGNLSVVLTLGSATSRTITGSLTAGDGVQPLVDYRVVALGRWDETAPYSEVSTVDYVRSNESGRFAVTLADDVFGTVVIQAQPYAANTVAPTLYAPVAGNVSDVRLQQLANLGGQRELAIPIVGFASDGSMKPVRGATVIVTSSFEPQFPTSSTRAVLSAQATTGDDGIAHLTVLDDQTLDPGYRLYVVPPASSPFGVIYGDAFDIHHDTDVVTLPARFALRGTVVDGSGAPLSNVSVTVHPSPRFVWSLPDADQQFLLTEIPAATAVTPDDGTFVVWVDPNLSDVWASYDLTLEPPVGSAMPRWIRPAVDVETPFIANQKSLDVDGLAIPPAANIHGRIADYGGDSVAGGELRIFEIPPDPGLCTEVANPPASCAIPAQLLGHGASDDKGAARLSLPRF